MVDILTSPNFAPEARRDEVLLEAQRLAVSARDMLAAAAYVEHRSSEWAQEAERHTTPTQSAELAVSSIEPEFVASQPREEALSEEPWTTERIIGHISLIGQWVNYARDEALASRK